MITLALTFAKFCLLVSPVVILSILLLLWLDRRKIRRMKRNFKEAYQDWQNGNPEALNFAKQWHYRLSRSSR